MRKHRLTNLFYGVMFILAGCQPAAAPPYPPSERIKSVSFDWSTHVRLASGSDNWPVTWADDGHQYTSWGDGGGFGGGNSEGRVSLGVGRIEGAADAYRTANIWGGKNPQTPARFGGKSYGIASVNGELHMWVSPGSNAEAYEEARLYSSGDHGLTWSRASWSFTRKEHLVNPAFCQFGKDYSGARDGYLYIYAAGVKDSSALKVQKPGEIALMRVPANAVSDRSQYEYFGGRDARGAPLWVRDINDLKPVFRDANGVGWSVSVSYNAGLSRYFLITEHRETAKGNIGIFDAAEPWGPWTTVYYGKFGSGSKIPGTTFYYNFSNKWLGPDGRDFVVLFTGVGLNDSLNMLSGHFEMQEDTGSREF